MEGIWQYIHVMEGIWQLKHTLIKGKFSLKT